MNNKYAKFVKIPGACKPFAQESVNEQGNVSRCIINPGFSGPA